MSFLINVLPQQQSSKLFTIYSQGGLLLIRDWHMPKDTTPITKKQKGKYDKEKHGSRSKILFTTSL